MSDIDEMLAWLRAALDEDELVARDAGGRNWRREAYGCVVDAADNGLIVYSEGTPSREQADHIARHDPARVLREVEAKRRRLERHRPEARTVACGEAGYAETWLCCVQCSAPYGLLDPPEATKWPCLDIRDDAAIYSDRPDYQREWATP